MPPPPARKDQTTHAQCSDIADASVGTTDVSQSCVTMELVSSGDEDDSVTYIVLDEVLGDVNDQRDSPVSPEALSPPHDGRYTGESLQKESKVVRDAEGKEMTVDAVTVTDKTISQKPRRQVRHMQSMHPNWHRCSYCSILHVYSILFIPLLYYCTICACLYSI